MIDVYCNSILSQIGKGPLIELKKINYTGCKILAKLEAFNPSGSIKDVMAFYMTCKAESQGLLKPGSKIIEVTTGNTGIAFAMISAYKGYEFTAVMPENMSNERKMMMKAFGAKIVLTPSADDMKGAIEKYKELVKANPDAWLPDQFGNHDNITAHREITGRSILDQYKGTIDVFVAGVGTGGTLMGVSQALKEENPNMKVIAVEPYESSVMNGNKPGPHNIQGIGEGFIPELVSMDEIDEVIAIKSKDAIDMTAKLAKEEGLMVGISSGANVLAALRLGESMKSGGTIITILPDRGERYLSMNVY
ncbi:MAG: cysteine synthase A [bacterium]